MSRPILAARIALALTLLAGLASCQTVQTTQPGAVGVERKQAMLLSSSQVNNSASMAYQQEMKKAAGKNSLNRDAAQVARVRTIAQRLIPATSVFRPDAPKWAWEVNVITSADVNAWCMPGGKMAVYTGLIEKLKVTDDELAAVTLWQKMGQVGGSAPPQFLSTHPSPENRQKDLTDYAARVMPLYESARKR